MHDPAIQGFFDIPVDHLSAERILSNHFQKRDLRNTVVVSPDTGGVLRSRHFANRLKLPLAIIDKRRPEANQAVVMNVIGDVSGRDAIIFDDIIDTGGTLVKVAEALISKGAKRISACCSHAVLSGESSAKISNSAVTEIITTNSIPIPEDKRKACRLEVLSLAPLIGEAISRIFQKKSVSELFS